MKCEFTSEEIASISARGLHDPASLTLEEIQAVCGSNLTQARPRKNPPGAHAVYNAATPRPPINPLLHDMFWCRPVDLKNTIAANAILTGYVAEKSTPMLDALRQALTPYNSGRR
jgi:hypothetical protein